MTESRETFANPLLPACLVLPNLPEIFLPVFFLLFFFCLVSYFSSQFKRKSANYLLQICKCNFLLFKTQDEKVNWWTENRNKNKTHLARRKLGNAVENVWKRWDCSRSQRKLIWTLKKSSQCGYSSSWATEEYSHFF